MVVQYYNYCCSRWVELHREELSRHNSVLEFRLCQRKYLSLLSLARVTEAVEYAKTFSHFVPGNTKGKKTIIQPSYMYMYMYNVHIHVYVHVCVGL